MLATPQIVKMYLVHTELIVGQIVNVVIERNEIIFKNNRYRRLFQTFDELIYFANAFVFLLDEIIFSV